MKKLLYDFLYVLVALALVFGVVQYALPDVGMGVSNAPLVPKPTPIPVYVSAIEEIAKELEVPPEAEVLVLTFWSPDCKYCLEQLVALDDLVTSRPDVLVLGLTTEIDGAVIEKVIVETGLSFFTFYGLPRFPIEAVPTTHTLFRENGTWKLSDGGTWIGITDVGEIIQFIDEAGMNDNYKPSQRSPDRRA